MLCRKGITMKKEIVIIITIVTLAMAAVLTVLLIMRPKTLGNMSSSFSSPKTASSSFSFYAEAGDRLRISFSSDIKGGELTVMLENSDGSEVKTLDSARELKTYWTLEKTDTYTLSAECKEMVGSYKINVTKE